MVGTSRQTQRISKRKSYLTIAVDGGLVHILRVAGDSLPNEYPVDFAIKLYNDTTLLHTEAVTEHAGGLGERVVPNI